MPYDKTLYRLEHPHPFAYPRKTGDSKLGDKLATITIATLAPPTSPPIFHYHQLIHQAVNSPLPLISPSLLQQSPFPLSFSWPSLSLSTAMPPPPSLPASTPPPPTPKQSVHHHLQQCSTSLGPLSTLPHHLHKPSSSPFLSTIPVSTAPTIDKIVKATGIVK
ncbi:hypothetical protein Acr_23g0012950 [Actinidia rufa]|uniref:Uncharacterized protein n=1 Tax=Actinidia rufa TaxID=165716 RepID=A0A7J0GQ18_9ERIC|nr:hypothetical protein Acr_23g0012950 [Actinidia rufa]